MSKKQTPFRALDDEARELLYTIWHHTKHASLSTLLEGGQPYVSRIAICAVPEGKLISLVSDLALHSSALQDYAPSALMLHPPLTQADPLTQPRLSLICHARFIKNSEDIFDKLCDIYKKAHKMADMLLGFSDFRLVQFTAKEAHLNAGFGKAYQLKRDALLDCVA